MEHTCFCFVFYILFWFVSFILIWPSPQQSNYFLINLTFSCILTGRATSVTVISSPSSTSSPILRTRFGRLAFSKGGGACMYNAFVAVRRLGFFSWLIEVAKKVRKDTRSTCNILGRWLLGRLTYRAFPSKHLKSLPISCLGQCRSWWLPFHKQGIQASFDVQRYMCKLRHCQCTSCSYSKREQRTLQFWKPRCSRQLNRLWLENCDRTLFYQNDELFTYRQWWHSSMQLRVLYSWLHLGSGSRLLHQC